jgi:asparagine synthase (glutamine-hydrolysing)
MFLLSRLVRENGIKVVLTGEGADEMFAGYDLFREGRVRRFWGREPSSTVRPQLLTRLYPYLERSPVAQAAMARSFFGRDIEHWREPGFAHGPRWRSTAAIQRLFDAPVRDAVADTDVVAELLADLPADFATWSPLGQDQYLEARTLLSGYLLSSQGDRMLMANSVEGRFPFLDTRVVALADNLPTWTKLSGLDEKHILKRVAAGLVPEQIIQRSKQPYRAPDAVSFIGPDRPAWVDEVMRPSTIKSAGVFDPAGVERLWRKCLEARDGRDLSNGDNMALVGILSTGLLHDAFISHPSNPSSSTVFDIDVDRVARGAAAISR